MTALFISDLHLSSERPEKIALFKTLLQGAALKADALYILGDLFEAWAGDDDDTPPHGEIIAELAAYTNTGSKLFIMRGNRDYLISHRFAKMTGGQLIEDPALLKLNGEKVLLMHGDTLCTEDVNYQVFRRIINNAVSRKIFMLLPFYLRAKIWHKVRAATKMSSIKKPEYIIDVFQPAVEKVMQQYNTALLIHGHTHRRAIHEFKLDGKAAKRIVLGDWYNEDSILVADENGLRMMRIQEYLDSH